MKPVISKLPAPHFGPSKRNPWFLRIQTVLDGVRVYWFPTREEAWSALTFLPKLDLPWKPANATAAEELISAGGPKA